MVLASHPSLPSSLRKVCPWKRSNRRLRVGKEEDAGKASASVLGSGGSLGLLDVRSSSRASGGLKRRNIFIIGEGGI